MRRTTPTTTPRLAHSSPFAPKRSSVGVDEHAITLRLKPLRWRDRMLPEVLRWGSATGVVAAVAGAWMILATPPTARHAQRPRTSPEPMASESVESEPVLASARLQPEGWTDAPPAQEDDDEIIIILEDDELEDEIVIFDDTLDAPSAAAMAELHFDLADDETALQYAILAVEREPDDPAHHARLGQAYVLVGQDDAARQAFRRAQALRR